MLSLHTDSTPLSPSCQGGAGEGSFTKGKVSCIIFVAGWGPTHKREGERSMEKQKIRGRTEGVRDSVLEKMETWYDIEVGADEYLPREICAEMAAASAELRREIAVFITRTGDIPEIRIGDIGRVSSQWERLRRHSRGLNRVRLIHTHPGGDYTLSDPDLSTLTMMGFESVCAVGVADDGSVTGIQAAFGDYAPDAPCAQRILTARSFSRIDQEGWMREIAESESGYIRFRREEDGPERVILAGCDSERSLDELDALADSAGAAVVARFFQKRPRPDNALYIGRGKADEIALAVQNLDADAVIFDDELTGRQIRCLEEALGTKVLDRTALILDIFAQRARSNEGKLQVTAAQLKYRSTHLIGQGLVLSRLGGGIGTRGPGESKLEIDRRRIREQLTDIERRLEAMKRERDLRRRNRARNAVPVVALVGYTNVGKSSLMNRLSGSDVFVQDRLFATLDAVSRRVDMKDGTSFILVDTVGFVNKLPHDLVDAFRSTLEEAALADILVLVSDISDPDRLLHRQTVEEVLASLGADTQPRIEVLNKCDLPGTEDGMPDAVRVSAADGEGLDRLMEEIVRAVRSREQLFTVTVPYSRYGLIGAVRSAGRVISSEDGAEGTVLTLALTDEEKMQLIGKYPFEVTALPPEKGAGEKIR